MRAELTPIIGSMTGDLGRRSRDDRSVRADVERVNETVAAVTERVQRALDASEERLGEFNALLDVVQDEAERLFISAASTVRGVRRGAQAFRERSGTDLASDELDAAAEADATMIRRKEMATTVAPNRPRRRSRQAPASVRAMDNDGAHENEYDLLTAA